MLRLVLQRFTPVARQMIPRTSTSLRLMSSKPEESVEAFDARWEAYFDRKDIDDWEIRKGVNDLYGHDLVPEPRIVNAMLRACRRVNDLALAMRVMEMVKLKSSQSGNSEIYDYIKQNCQPALEELGVKTVEDLAL